MDKKNYWEDLLKLDEDQLQDLRHAGYAYLRQGKYDMALPFFEALVAISSRNSYDLQTLGGLYLQLNFAMKALKTLDKALKNIPDHLPTLINRCKSLLMLGYKEKGLRLAEKLHKSNDTSIANTAEALLIAYS